MNKKELINILQLSVIHSIRMFSIFIVLPVLSTYGMYLQKANEFLIGIAIGIYGLTQTIFQIPYGLMSDKIGRKQIIILGLLIFFIGSLIISMNNNIWGLIIGRAIQGIGVISAPLLALMCDITRVCIRTKAIAIFGINIGITFTMSIVISPMITEIMGIHGLFNIITVLSFVNIFLAILIIPKCHICTTNKTFFITYDNISKILTNYKLIYINISIFLLHTILTFNFIVLPKKMEIFDLSCNQQCQIYLIIMLISLIAVIPTILYIEKKINVKLLLILFICMILCAEIMFINDKTKIYILLIGLQIFFLSFNTMEAILPSLLSKTSPVGYRGTCMGLYSTSQFIGIACGGILGGWLIQYQGMNWVLFMGIILSILWLVISYKI